MHLCFQGLPANSCYNPCPLQARAPPSNKCQRLPAIPARKHLLLPGHISIAVTVPLWPVLLYSVPDHLVSAPTRFLSVFRGAYGTTDFFLTKKTAHTIEIPVVSGPPAQTPCGFWTVPSAKHSNYRARFDLGSSGSLFSVLLPWYSAGPAYQFLQDSPSLNCHSVLRSRKFSSADRHGSLPMSCPAYHAMLHLPSPSARYHPLPSA